MSLKRAAVFSAVAISILSILFLIYYELNLDMQDPSVDLVNSVHIVQNRMSEVEHSMAEQLTEMKHQAVVNIIDPVQDAVRRFRSEALSKAKDDDDTPLEGEAPLPPEDQEEQLVILSAAEMEPKETLSADEVEDLQNKRQQVEHHDGVVPAEVPQGPSDGESGDSAGSAEEEHPLTSMDKATRKALTKRGMLKCPGKEASSESEVIYWKVVPGDIAYESPITPHHGIHHDRYLTFESDQGGWNNVRMGIEVFIVCAHAMGRTLVLPPAQNLYLLYLKHKGK